jgi:hypothetical protein
MRPNKSANYYLSIREGKPVEKVFETPSFLWKTILPVHSVQNKNTLYTTYAQGVFLVYV